MRRPKTDVDGIVRGHHQQRNLFQEERYQTFRIGHHRGTLRTTADGFRFAIQSTAASTLRPPTSAGP